MWRNRNWDKLHAGGGRGCEDSQAPAGEGGRVAMPPVGREDRGQGCGVLTVTVACDTT